MSRTKIFRAGPYSEGVTLVEVVVSAALVALIVSVVVFTVSQSAVDSSKLDMIYTASNLARKHMDSLKTVNFRDLADLAPETDVRVNAEGDADADGDYVRSTEVYEDWNSNPYLTKIKVSVDRVVDGEASGRPVMIETLFADAE